MYIFVAYFLSVNYFLCIDFGFSNYYMKNELLKMCWCVELFPLTATTCTASRPECLTVGSGYLSTCPKVCRQSHPLGTQSFVLCMVVIHLCWALFGSF